MEKLGEMLDEWETKGLPERPALAPKELIDYEPSIFEIDHHWTCFIDKTVGFSRCLCIYR